MKIKDGASDDSHYRLLSTTRGDLIFYDGARKIEILTGGISPEIILYAASLQRWRYPHHEDPLTKEIKEKILFETERLLKSSDPRWRVKVEW